MNDSLNNAMDGLPTRYIALGVNTDYTHDSLNRRQKTTVDLERDIVTDYNYKTSARTEGKYHTNQLLSEKIDGTLYKYTYDKVGNITAIAKGGVTYRTYTYDALNQLLSETNHIDGTRTEYEYNHLGNIRFKKIYSTEDNKLQKQTEYKYYTDTDTGWWLDLTEIETIEYNSNGVATKTTKEKVNYDTIGNPTTYRDATMSWYGRQLTNYSKGSTTASFTYDADGLRGTKTVDGTKTVYQYVGDKLFYEKRGKKQEFYYFYDSYGKLSSIYYHYDSDDDEYDSSAVYFVTTNSQGDVIGLYNNKGVKVAAYEYDAWGNILSVKDSTGKIITNQDHIANANPFRYRGYYYDADLGLYYLQSRYYDSTVGRFINADSTYLLTVANDNVSDKNLFAYCDNNPVSRVDDGGGVWETVFDIVSLGFSVYDVVKNPYDPWAWAGLAGDTIDLIPFATGVGETIKAAKIAKKTIEVADDVHDATKKLNATSEVVQKVSNSVRSGAVRKAWKNELLDVRSGGSGISRTWTNTEKIELLSTGRVRGYQGHHMKSVKGYPQLAGDPMNIQFLTRAEHLMAHSGNFRNITHGRYFI